MEVDTERDPAEGEVYLFTTAGNFCVKGSPIDVSRRISADEWPTFELTETGDTIIIRSAQVVAIRGGTKPRRSIIGFTHHE
jgi:hypothetical protein